MSTTKSAKRTGKLKKAAAKRTVSPMKKIEKKQQHTEIGEREHEKMEHPWPDPEKQTMGEGEAERQQNW